MHIYFSGIGGAGISALAHMAVDAGYSVSGTDLNTDSSICQELAARGVKLSSDQSGDFLAKQHHRQPVDWLIYSGAITEDHAERTLALERQIKQAKRHSFIKHLVDKYDLQLLAVSGTHGKTTTTAMAAWVLNQLEPISWLIGSTITFGHHGQLDKDSQWLVLEADEYDRMMLEFSPQLSLITTVEYDHPDTYPTEDEYRAAFRQFVDQSATSVGWLEDAQKIELPNNTSFQALESPTLAYDDLPLLGAHNRANAELAACGLEIAGLADAKTALEKLANFPGTARRFERIKPNLISDYAHHPTEIKSTLELANEYKVKQDLNRIVVVYQPHLDERQREVKADYKHSFDLADMVYWLPTYNPPGRHQRPPMPPEKLVEYLDSPEIATVSKLNQALLKSIDRHLEDDDLVLVMGAGSVDGFVRPHFLADIH